MGSKAELVAAMAKECIEGRERGLMPTVDLASQLSTNRIPVNMADGIYVPADKGCVHVACWTPEPDGKGKTTQVHLMIDLAEVFSDPEMPKIVHRMKSGPGVDQLIQLLAEARASVWLTANQDPRPSSLARLKRRRMAPISIPRA